MAQIKTQAWTFGLLLTLAGAAASAQQVEYVTRNVEPTHAVRFNSQPIRITITDRGIRQPLASAPVVRRGFKHRRFGPAFYGSRHRIGGGVIVIRQSDTTETTQERPAPRTFYGRGHDERGASATTNRPEPATDRRHQLRVLSLIQSQNRSNAPKTAGAEADDR